jgi:transcriptional regulator with XRE-family HTH domain
MSRTLKSRRHKALGAFLFDRRREAKLTQATVASRLRRNQSFIADIESGQRRVDVVELLDIAKAIGFDPREAIKRLSAMKPD